MNIQINAKKIKQVINGEVITVYDTSTKTKLDKKPGPLQQPVHVFVSYSHADIEIKEKLDKHFTSLLRTNDYIASWSDNDIKPGEEWDAKIKDALNKSSVILLLVSAGFIASDYIWKTELNLALRRQEEGEAVVIPILCKACNFQEMPFAKLQALPKNMIPLADQSNLDAALSEVVQHIKATIDHHTGRASSNQS